MQHSVIKFFALGGIALALSACQPKPENNTQTNPVPAAKQNQALQTESLRLAKFFANTFEEDLNESPMAQGYLGLKRDQDKWDDISENSNDKNAVKLKQRLETINGFDLTQLNEQETLSHAIYKINLERELANDDFRHHSYIMDQFRAWHTTVPSFLINIHSIKNIEDAKAYISRLNKIQGLFEQLVDQLEIREKLGVFPPKWSYDQMIQASHNVISGYPFEESDRDSTIFADFKAKLEALGLSKMESGGLLNQAEKALQTSVKSGYEKLIQELGKQRLLTPEGDGVWRLPDGQKWYQNRLNWFTTTDLTAKQVHQLGIDNVNRIHEQMRGIMKKVGFKDSLPQFFEFMRSDPQFYYPNTDEGRQQYMRDAKDLIDKMEARIPEYFGLTPKAKMVIKRVEAFREKSAGKAFYNSPAKDGSRPGTYYANLYNMNDMPRYQMEALAYHEGIPGHHMQRAIAQELEGIPEFQKYASFTAYTEGWGLYTEELGKDMGFYQDPYSDFGRLAMELWRACRLVVDTGIHSLGWSREKAIQYLIDNTPNPQNDAVKAIERYIAMPGQATAYMIGKIKIMALRKWAQEYLGDQFDIRSFHDEILKDGPVPLNLLEQKIKTWAEKQKNAA